MSVNIWTGLGNIGKDPELKYLQDGTAVVNFSVACSQRWKDKNTNEQKERTEWINCSCFGKMAETIAQYFHKGSKIWVTGEIRTRKYQAQDGSDRYSTGVHVSSFDFIDSKNTQNPQQNPQQNSTQQAPTPYQSKEQRAAPVQEQEAYQEDSIPF